MPSVRPSSWPRWATSKTHHDASDGGYDADPRYLGTAPGFDRHLARALSPLQHISKLEAHIGQAPQASRRGAPGGRKAATGSAKKERTVAEAGVGNGSA